MARYDRTKLIHPRIIVCEGSSDEAFFRALIKARGLPEFCIRSPIDIQLAGISNIGKTIASLKAATGFFDVVDIVVVVDSDDDPNANFLDIVDQIKKLSDPLFSPPENLMMRGQSTPAITIATLPSAVAPGNLETFCYPVALAANPVLAVHVEDFVNKSGVLNWPNQQKQAKARLSSLLAVARHQHPGMTLGKVWIEHPDTVPLNHPAFDELANFLSGFAAPAE